MHFMPTLDLTLSALSHPIRRAALRLLADGRECCLCELMAALDVSQPTMSRHMAALRDCGLVGDRRDAQWVRYRRRPSSDHRLQNVVEAVLAAAREADEIATSAADHRSAA